MTVQSLHLQGAGGVGMCGMAEVLSSRGLTISGCDLAENERTRRLTELGMLEETALFQGYLGKGVHDVTCGRFPEITRVVVHNLGGLGVYPGPQREEDRLPFLLMAKITLLIVKKGSDFHCQSNLHPTPTGNDADGAAPRRAWIQISDRNS